MLDESLNVLKTEGICYERISLWEGNWKGSGK